MILAKLNPDRFVDLVRNAPLIAFQKLEYGYAVAAPGEAYYAPLDHPGGGNLSADHHQIGGNFADRLGWAFIERMSTPALRTLRPTAKPIMTDDLRRYLNSLSHPSADPAWMFSAYAAGDHATVIDSECQVVIQAIEEHERPDLKDAMRPAKREALSDALDLVIQHAESARELCEVGDDKPQLVRLYLLQSSTAMKSALEMLLQP